MTSNNRDNDYLEKLKEVDGNVKARLDREFGQLRVIAVVVMVLVALVIIGRWLIAS